MLGIEPIEVYKKSFDKEILFVYDWSDFARIFEYVSDIEVLFTYSYILLVICNFDGDIIFRVFW